MWATLRRLFNQFFRRTRTINNEPLNKVSLIVIILIDIFILINVFTGLNDISQWYLSPSQIYPCYADWKIYRATTDKDKDYQILRGSMRDSKSDLVDLIDSTTWRQDYQRVETNHLGKVFSGCLNYAEQRDRVNIPKHRETIKIIDSKQSKISVLQQKNQTIRSQYDSTLLEKIAGQERTRSINSVSAEKARQELEGNNQKIADLNSEISKLKSELLATAESNSFLSLIKDESKFKEVETKYQRSDFWYPSIQLIFQALFLLPLIAIALLVHSLARRRGYGLVALMSWHLLAIFSIPLIIKVFEFLQIGIIFRWIFDLVVAIFGQLLFLISFVYILLIPLVGFGIIKSFQKFVFNPKIQASNRVQASRCMNCARKIHPQNDYCPHCGYAQYRECPNCHNLTYKNLPYCKECGHHLV